MNKFEVTSITMGFNRVKCSRRRLSWTCNLPNLPLDAIKAKVTMADDELIIGT